MGVLKRLLEVIVDVTRRLDEEVEKGYDLRKWGEQMKYLHALQIQAQALIDIVLRLSSLLGHPPSTPLDAGRFLHEAGILASDELAFFRKVVGFRNIVVHEYLDIDMGLVEEILRERKYRKVLELAYKLYRVGVERNLDP